MSPAIRTSAWCWKTSCGVRVVAAMWLLSVDRCRLDPPECRARWQACEDRRTMAEPSAALTYTSYLALDEILGAQRPKTGEHDELLFIVIHQVYELWFKQLIHELVHLQQRLEEGEGAGALATVRRVLTILKTVVAQIDVLETMTPGQFASFRTRLDSASGFQSAQFRELEAVLGR